ncbi:MAG TPA: hypothetical protein VKE40_17510 [Gemmataceae bacterium]|nr:hypothetical protein [Gemmataceae bacterium]
MSIRNLLSLGAAALLALAPAGCSDGPKVAKVSGTLTYQGKPVPNATIHFVPAYGRPSWAQTDAEGKFKVNYDADQDGAVVGTHKVYLEYRPITQAEQEAVMYGALPKPPKDFAVIYDKYGPEKSTLTVEIKKDTRDLKLELE